MAKKKKISKKAIFLAVVALLEIILISITIAYGWIESSSSLEVTGTNIKTKGRTMARAIMGPVNNDIDLNKYIREYLDEKDSFLIGEASSNNGKDFFFETGNSIGNDLVYRYGNINDANVNYINFDFLLTCNEDTAVWFHGVPKITIKGAPAEVSKAIRFAISDGETTKIFKNNTDEVHTVKELNNTGTIKTTAKQETHKYEDFVYKKEILNDPSHRLIDLSKNEEKRIEFSIWLESFDPNCNIDNISGAELDIDINLCTTWSIDTEINLIDETVSNGNIRKWIDSGSDLYVVDNNEGNNPTKYYKLEKIGDKWTGEVPMRITDNIRIIRCNPGSKNPTNYWITSMPADSNTFTALYSYDNSNPGHGTWEETQKVKFQYIAYHASNDVVKLGYTNESASSHYFYPLYRTVDNNELNTMYESVMPKSATNLIFRSYKYSDRDSTNIYESQVIWNAGSKDNKNIYFGHGNGGLSGNQRNGLGEWDMKGTRIFFSDNNNKGNVHCYWWIDGGSGPVGWPGTRMNISHQSSNGRNVYSIVVPENLNRLIVNYGSGKDQSSNYNFSDRSKHAFYPSGNHNNFTLTPWDIQPGP